MDVLDDRALGRATLARQLLLERTSMPVLDAVEHLVGLQAQEPLDPYVALWSRLADFAPGALESLLIERALVRIVVMRATIHLVTADDATVLRPLMQPVLDAELARHPEHRAPLAGVDLAPVLAFTRRLVSIDGPRTQAELRRAFEVEFPGAPAGALAYACRNLLAFVQVPPRGLWSGRGQVRSTTLEAWTGRTLAEHPSLDRVVLRYLGAFGPASVADVGTWSRLTGMRAVVERLRPQLRSFRTTSGRELLDLPDAPRPDPDTPAPARFLPRYDDVALSHADRGRLIPEHRRTRLAASSAPVHGSFLADGTLWGTWRTRRTGEAVILELEPVEALPRPLADELEAEGHRLLALLAPDAAADVRVLAVA